jgi:uncharacterized protein
MEYPRQLLATILTGLVFVTGSVAEAGTAEEAYEKAISFIKTQFYKDSNKQGVAQAYKEAVKWYRKAIEQGDANAQYRLGMMYDNGRGVARNYKEAVKWYKKSAVHGNAQAQLRLGLMYEEGKGVLKNYKEAVKWYKKSAEQGDASAQVYLGYMYEEGQGVAQDYVQAHKWFNLATAAGHGYAVQYRDIVVIKMTDKQIAEAKKLAAEWLPASPNSKPLRK